MSITFGGLATGMDTDTLIKQLLSVERSPITRLEADKTWMNTRLANFQALDVNLQGFLSSIEGTSDREQYFQRKATTSSDDFFSSDITNEAISGASYSIEVESLAQVQKSFSNNGFAAKDTLIFGTGEISFTVGTDAKSVTIAEGENSLEGIMKAINNSNIGVNASILNDGSATDPYRLTLTSDTAATSFTLDTGVAGLGNAADFTTSQAAAPASIKVDGISITSTSNTFSEAIPGVTLDLLHAELGTTTTLTISSDNDAVAKNIKNFVYGYNSVISFITGQSTMGDTESGVLSGDSGLNTIKRHLQDMLTSRIDNGGAFTSLSQLGLETQKDGTIKLNSEVLDSAIEDDLTSVTNLLAGKEGDDNGGIAKRFETYLSSLTNSTTGMLAGRSESINMNSKRIDTRIEQMETRLVKREVTLRAQFTAMEQMVSLMNSTSDYLTSQMSALENLWNYNR